MLRAARVELLLLRTSPHAGTFYTRRQVSPQLLVQIVSLKGTGEFFGWEKNPGQLANCHKFSKMMLRYAGIFRQTKLCNNELVFQRKFLSGWFSVDRPLVYFLCFHNIFSLLFWIGHHYETRFLSRRGQQQRPSHKLVTWSKANFCISLSFEQGKKRGEYMK